ncbi:solute carrier family 2, facilitated glucose transporter member 1-like isoform X2 [Antedon mediterranea]|uniref:solute carrier family 2, facilitated glucose transporter member 1-like isoform X2 n=1 Tax=Antedon mediterranea TaxID=105859 RepID=UPI003AF7E8D9
MPLNEETKHSQEMSNFDEGKHEGKVTKVLTFTVASAVIGSSLQFGYNTGVINAPQQVITDWINESYYDRTNKLLSEDTVDFLWSTTVAIFAIGGMIGSFTAGPMANRLGRKRGLLLNNVLALIGALFMGFSKQANSCEMLIIGRFVIGINCGINTGIVPMFLSEIAPFDLRGGVGVFNQLGVTFGILISQIFGLKDLLGTEDLWALLLGLTAVPAIFQILVLPFCPESPRYLLINKDQPKEAEKALKRLRNLNDVSYDINEMQAEYDNEQKEDKVSVKQLFQMKSLRLPLIISIVMQLSQQLSGINGVLYYSTSIFEDAGIDPDKSAYATLSTGTVMVIMTIVTIPLMDKTGRRTLHLWGLGLMALWASILTVSLATKDLWGSSSYLSIVAVIAFVVAFALGPGSIPWLIVAELFSQGPRGAAISVAFFINWSANFLVGLTFPFLQKSLDAYVFVIFIILLVIFWLFTYKFLPETKNKSFEEISAIFRKEAGKKDEYTPLIVED